MYKEIKPRHNHKDYIHSYWLACVEKDALVTIVEPDGCFDIIINFKDDDNDILMTGIWDRPIQVKNTLNDKSLGIRFFPAALEAFFDMDIADIRNTVIDINNVSLKKEIDLEFIRTCKDYNEIIFYYNFYFESMFNGNYDSHELLHRLIDEVKKENNIEIVSKQIGISRKHLTRLLKKKIGLTTKTYANIIRFMKAKEMLNDGFDLSEILYRCGYYDQSHFIKEFKKFSGKTPNNYK